jgi:small subunit ribosomal protein S16
MVRIRLKRVGAKKHPFYRIVVADQRAARDGAFIEQIGTYDPFPDPREIKIDEEKYKAWVAKGAQPSESVVSLMQSVGVLPRVITAPPVEEKAAPKAAPKAAAKAEPKKAAAATATAVAEKPAEEEAAEEVVEETAEAATEDAPEATAEEAPEAATEDAPEAAAEESSDDDASYDESKEASSD